MESSPHLKFPVKKLGAADLSHFEAKRAPSWDPQRCIWWHLLQEKSWLSICFDLFPCPIPMTDPAGAGRLMLTWLGYIDGIYVSIYTSTRDPIYPMGYVSHMWLLLSSHHCAKGLESFQELSEPWSGHQNWDIDSSCHVFFLFLMCQNHPTMINKKYVNYWLVLFRHPSEKSWNSSVGMMKFHILWKVIICYNPNLPNHQADYVWCLI